MQQPRDEHQRSPINEWANLMDTLVRVYIIDICCKDWFRKIAKDHIENSSVGTRSNNQMWNWNA